MLETKGTKKGITPCLWFHSNGEEAARFYVSIFKNSAITGVSHYRKAASEASGRPEGSVMTVTFELEGQEFLALNGGPAYKFSPAISFMVHCDTQEELDTLWSRLSEGGEEVGCGWLTDRYGLSWQIIPTFLAEMLLDKDTERTNRVMAALIKMKKLDVSVLKAAFEGR